MKTQRTRCKHRQTVRRQPSSNYVNQLKKLYPLCKHDDKSQTCEKYDGHDIVYGEMTYEGIETLYTIVSKYGIPEYFLDVGSGRGKLCLFMASKPNIVKSIGIELVSSRVDDAEKLKKSLIRSKFAKKCEFINANIFDVSISDKINGPAFVWFSNLCFDPSLTERIYSKLVDELPIGSIICSSKIPENPPNGLKSLGVIQVGMSWNELSNVYMYQKQ